MILEPTELPTAAELEAFFFNVHHTVGWVSQTPRTKSHPLIIGWEQITYEERIENNNILFFDEWGSSVGCTTIALIMRSPERILYQPLWVMHYRGSYPAESLSLVKKALAAAYSEKKFSGGRGTHALVDGDMAYKNLFTGNFSRFSGRDSVVDLRGGEPSERGYHEYWGGLLIPDSATLR